MHLFPLLPVLSLLLGTLASSHNSRQPALHRLDVRDPFIDACASLNTAIEIPGQGVVAGIDACICLSGIPIFLETDFGAAVAVQDAGLAVVTDILTQLITDQAAQSNCVFPENSVPSCGDGNQNCGFTCTNGFTASLDSNPPACVCNPPYVVCNGQCQESSACPSSQPLRKRRSVGSSCSEKGPGWAACGVYGGSSRAWECVNTARDLESCGGCTIPLTPYSPIGTDCSAIPGVADVACLYGECVVYRCLPGYEHAHDGHSCVRKFSQFEEEDVPANVYGLEHVPLGRH